LKVCIRCGETKPYTDYYKIPANKDGYQNRCKACHNKVNAECRKWHPVRGKRQQIKYRYGITWDEFILKLKAQHYKCAICDASIKEINSLSEKIETAVIDHCHKTKKLRGLLCMNCNAGIGSLKDNPALLIRAAHYLDSYNES
jgi:hypothetical protein